VLTSLEAVVLVPAVELEPFAFAASDRTHPAGTGPDSPEEWSRYWFDSLADSGLVGLNPLRPRSWHVPVAAFTNPVVLGRYLDAVIRRWDGPEALTDPDARPVLNGGLALCSGGEVLVEPSCCGDLANQSEWRDAAAYRQAEWKMVWVGHPWVSVRFDADRLVFSEPHESDAPNAPNARWSVRPEELGRAVAAAYAELEVFARHLRSNLADMGVADANTVAKKLAGLER
jgi:hypothetical protein